MNPKFEKRQDKDLIKMAQHEIEIVPLDEPLIFTRVGDGLLINSKENDTLQKGGYEMNDLIGEGGYSKTYRGLAKKDQRIVAIRILRKSLIEELKIHKFVQREIATLQ